MMERSRNFPKALVLVLVLALLVLVQVAARPAAAQELSTHLGFAAQVGGCLPSLSDVNRQVRLGDRFLEDKGWKPLGEVKLGFNFTGDFRCKVSGPVWASIGGGTVFGRAAVDFDEVIKVKPSASFYHLRLLYDVPFHPRPRMLLRLGAGPVYSPQSKLSVEHQVRRVEGGTQRVEKVDFKGKGWGAHGFLEAEYMLNSRTTLVADFGYRRLKVKEDSFHWQISEILLPNSDEDADGVPNKFDLDENRGIIANAFLEVMKEQDGTPQIINAAGMPLVVNRGIDAIDFSGPLLNVGLRIYFF